MKKVLLVFFLFYSIALYSQEKKQVNLIANKDWKIDYKYDFYKKRKQTLLITESSLFTSSLIGLNYLWYQDYPRSSFHFINDNNEWLQMDKIGHMASSYYTGVVGIEVYKWAGFSNNYAIWYGGLTGSFFLSIVEILDGYSQEWGASMGDMFANVSGSLLAISQELLWNEQKIQAKFSYSRSPWSYSNPDQLGSNNIERILKDYNGQTYWISFNIKSLLNIELDNFPTWLSLSLGYGAEAMISPYQIDDQEERYRQYLLSFDVDLNKIKTKYKYLNNILHTFGFIKFPAPALEYSKNKFHLHSIYY